MKFNVIFLSLLFYSQINHASVASQSLTRTLVVENPASLRIKNQNSHITFQNKSGSGTYIQGQLEREKITTSETRGILGYVNSDKAIQLLYLPKRERNIDEITQYSRATAQQLDDEIKLAFAQEYSSAMKWGLGFSNQNKLTDTAKLTTNSITSGLNYSISNHWHLGASAKLMNSASEFEQNKSWVESQVGVAWESVQSHYGLRAEYTLGRSPKVYQKPNKDIGGNYQREWSQNQAQLELKYELGFFQLCAGFEQRSRKYKAFEEGEDEQESEQTILVGLSFFEETFGVFAGQNKKVNKIASVSTTLNANVVSLLVSF
jgi:hypothetical protein